MAGEIVGAEGRILGGLGISGDTAAHDDQVALKLRDLPANLDCQPLRCTAATYQRWSVRQTLSQKPRPQHILA